MDAGTVERNLRDMFRSVAADRAAGEVRELPGVTIASAGSEFQMFNAAFFNSSVVDQKDLERRINLASAAFKARKLSWSLWICEELIPEALRLRLDRTCGRAGLHFSAEMPGMVAEALAPAKGPSAELEIHPVEEEQQLREFCRIGAACFHVPLPWFHEIFDKPQRLSGGMRAWLGYLGGRAVTTAATVVSAEAIGLYNLATVKSCRKRGLGEAMFRHAISRATSEGPRKPLVLQSTEQGLRLYERLGFRQVGRILVFPSR